MFENPSFIGTVYLVQIWSILKMIVWWYFLFRKITFSFTEMCHMLDIWYKGRVSFKLEDPSYIYLIQIWSILKMILPLSLSLSISFHNGLKAEKKTFLALIKILRKKTATFCDDFGKKTRIPIWILTWKVRKGIDKNFIFCFQTCLSIH